MQKISIIIPAYNEEKRIGEVLAKYCEFFRKEKDSVEIIVVLNACEDNTKAVVNKFQKKFQEIRFIEFKQAGKGFAITEGFKEALKEDFELIGFVDADMATPPEAFYALVKNIKNYDGVIANRWDKRSKIGPRTFFRKILSRGIILLFVVYFFLLIEILNVEQNYLKRIY